jgi:hypothetical protein
MTGKRTISRRIALALLVAVTVPAAQAATHPNDRPGPLGAAPGVSAATPSVRPDDRAGPLGIGSQTASQPSAGLRLDDRPGIRGAGSSEPVTPSLRPDDRPGSLGIGVVEVAPVSSGDGFDWGDAGLGLALGLAGALLLALHRLPRARRTGAAAAG